MRRLPSRLADATFVTSLVASLGALGCSVAVEDSIFSAERTQEASHLPSGPNAPLSIAHPDRWIGKELNLPPDTWEDLGELTIETELRADYFTREVVPPPEKGTPASDVKLKVNDLDIPDLRFVGFDLTGKRAYRLTVKSDNAKAITAAVIARGGRKASFGDLPPPSPRSTLRHGDEFF